MNEVGSEVLAAFLLITCIPPEEYCMRRCDCIRPGVRIYDYRHPGNLIFRQRPYCVECTGSLLNSVVKWRKARIVLGWVTAREVLRVLLTFLNLIE